MPQTPAIGADVSSLMPPVGADVSHLMGDANQSAPATSEPDHNTLRQLYDVVKDVGIGGLKSGGQTAVNLAKFANWIAGNMPGLMAPGQQAANSQTLDAASQKIGEPTGLAQQAGGLAADVGLAFVPAGEVGELSKAAEAAVGGSKLLKLGARTAVQGAAGAGIAAAQGGNPVTGAVLGGVGGAVSGSGKAAAAMRSSADTSMVRALGPAGGRGPVGALLADAEEIAPKLVKEGFTPLSQNQARSLASAAVKRTGPAVQTALQQFGGQSADVTPLLSDIRAARAALRTPGANGPYLTTRAAPTDALYGELEDDVTALGSKPTATQIHDLKEKWNAVVNWDDPASATLSMVYKKGGDWIRALLRNDHDEISKADEAYHVAKTLNAIVSAPSVRRPGAGLLVDALTPMARPAAGAVIGGTAGYKEGGVTGALAGSVTGAALGKLIQAPGFRYVSAGMKSNLAAALEKGDTARVSQLMTVIAAQATAYERANAPKEP